MEALEWAFAITLITRFISLRRQKTRDEPSSVHISGGEISKFLITFFFMYCWYGFWFRILGGL
jgi:hypothetical protein